jgi:hypothetical protein
VKITTSVFLLVALSFARSAAASPAPTCTVHDVEGVYAFYANGSVLEPGIPLSGPFSRIGYFIADGNGGLQISAVALYDGIDFGPENFPGTYSVSSDCVYSMVAHVGSPIFAPSPASGQVAAGGDNITFMAVGVHANVVGYAQRRMRRLNARGQGAKCATGDFEGAYRMEVNGFVNLPPFGNGTAYRQVGRFDFDGKGGLLASLLTSDSGAIRQDTGAGTYVVHSDCTVDLTYQIRGTNYGIRGTVIDPNQAFIALNMPGVPEVIFPGLPSTATGAVATGTLMRQW